MEDINGKAVYVDLKKRVNGILEEKSFKYDSLPMNNQGWIIPKWEAPPDL